MTWLASNWFIILFVGGMVGMHLRHGGHRHGGSHQSSRRGDPVETAGGEHSGHELGKPPTTAAAPSHDRVELTSTGRKEAV